MIRERTYGDHWDNFYQKTYGRLSGGKALWDVPVASSAALDLPLMKPMLETSLPLLDVGCGTGDIALYFASHFPGVIGVDVSPTAIDIAQRHAVPEHVTFQVLDMTDTQACHALAREMGPMHVYIRGVMHQIEIPDLPVYVDNIRTLLGGKGTLYMIEVAAHIRDHFLEASSSYHQLPKAVQEIFIANLPPRGVTLDDVFRYYKPEDFRVSLCEPATLHTNLTLSSGERIEIPAIRAILQAK
ncbi:MAG TPA: class I SAM-dependent methyltransferase [Saprospiraceae bacterium]|nr:class I SAM-dependent methyltransferase [Saprospiraceae bacterium]HRW75894.1 class I SAM-dependent methyltransferase [Saprospiraceae bacterium]